MNAIPASKGYLIVDSTKCTGCYNCMIACSLAHEGVASLSLSRVLVIQKQLAPFPDDIRIHPCRQCIHPLCLEACEIGALHVDTRNGNIRVIDEDICIGCRMCYDACPYEPKGIMWHFEKEIAIKCDLCVHTPYWTKKSDFAGNQVCIEVCPVNAIAFSGETPVQEGNRGHEVNLRNKSPNP